MKKYQESITIFDGREYINTTPHPVTLQDPNGEKTCAIPPCGFLLNATTREVDAGVHSSGASLVTTEFLPTLEGVDFLETIPAEVIVIGSIIAAQAYPGRVMAMVPCAGFERVAPTEKRMRSDKFTVFSSREDDKKGNTCSRNCRQCLGGAYDGNDGWGIDCVGNYSDCPHRV